MSSKNKIETKSIQDIKMLFWSIFVGSKSCINRVKIVLQLKQTPLNTNQLSVLLGLDYKVVEHHLEILEKQNLVEEVGHEYGSIYILTTKLESNFNLLNEVVGKSKNCNENLQKHSS